MKNNYFTFHPHNTPEENPRVKYHIVSDSDVELRTLCGIDTTEKLLNYSCNGDAITMEWYNQNIKYSIGIVCKKCSKKLFMLLNRED